MVILLLSLLFFVISFGPRYFTYMNFGFSFLDLGLNSQALCNFTQGVLNPYIPSVGKFFFTVRPEPFFILLYPITLLTTNPTVFLVLDELAVIFTAVICSHFTWRKTLNYFLTYVVFLSVLFSFFTFESLHGVARLPLWLGPGLSLFFQEYFLKRRPAQLALWLSVLCLTHLSMCFLGLLLIPFVLLTETSRWRLRRRLDIALVLACVSMVFYVAFRFIGGEVGFDWEAVTTIYATPLFHLAASFMFFALLVPEVVVVSLFLCALTINYSHSELALLVPIWAIGTAVSFKRLKWSAKRRFSQISAWGVLGGLIYFNLAGGDLFFHFWEPSRWEFTDGAAHTQKLLSHIPAEASVGASDLLTPFLACHPDLVTVSALSEKSWSKPDAPRYLVCVGLPCPAGHDLRYRQVEINLETETRLFLRSE